MFTHSTLFWVCRGIPSLHKHITTLYYGKVHRKSTHSPLFSLLVHLLSSSKLQHCSLGSPSAELSMHWQPLLSAEVPAQPADEELPLPLCKPPDTEPNSSPVTRDARSFTRYSLHCCCLGNPHCRNNHSHTPPIGWGYGAYTATAIR